MVPGKAVVTGVAGRVAVPRKYVRAALRGLQAVAGRCSHVPMLHDDRHALDEALHYAASFQERSFKRWSVSGRNTTSSTPILNNNDDSNNRVQTEELGCENASLKAIRTLQHLVMVDGRCDTSYMEDMQTTSDGYNLTPPTFSEKQQAKTHATLQQWVVYCGFRATRAEFMARQSIVSKVLFLSPVRVVSGGGRNPQAASSLETSLRRRGAEAYVDLLVHHRLTLQEEKEWSAVCLLDAPVGKLQRSSGRGTTAPVITLPFSRSDASWERSLAVLSWAVHFQGDLQQQRFHISSVDIARVLQQYAQQFGERRQVFGLDQLHDEGEESRVVKLAVASHDATVLRLQRLWVDAREAEKKDSRLAVACQLDRTASGWIHVEGRKVALKQSSEGAVSGDAVFAELLLQGRWEEVLRHICARATSNNSRGRDFLVDMPRCEGDDVCVVNEDTEELRCGVGCASLSPLPSQLFLTDPIVAMFNSSRQIFVKSKLWSHTPISRSERVRQSFLLAKKTPEEVTLLQNPPTAALRPRCKGKKREVEAKEGSKSTTTNPLEHFSFSELVDFRRKLWILSQLPRHVPLSLVCFEGSGSSMLPYLWRCPAKELAPWFLLSALVAIVAREKEGHGEDVEKMFSSVRLQVLNTLFVPHPHYAAFQEYCADLLVQLGSVLAPPEMMRAAVRYLLQPPSLRHFYDILRGRRVPVEVACREIMWGSTDETGAVTDNKKDGASPCFSSLSLSPAAVAVLGRLRSDPTTLRDFVVAKCASLRNYHISTWIENCSKVETLSGLLEMIVQEVNEYGPPLFSPEAAAALLTAVVIPLIGVDGSDESGAVMKDVLNKLGVVYFVVPADRVLGARSYFGGVYHDSYLINETIQWTGGWNGVEALLVGRSLRQTTKYPATTTDMFFRVERSQWRWKDPPKMTFRVPELRLRLMTLDILGAVRYFEGKENGKEQKQGGDEEQEEQMEASISSEIAAPSELTPKVVAHNLPFGVAAVYKPAGVSTTLHAMYPHLIHYLTRNVPWRGAGTPILFQHGLVNRIDVGTSGLVLVTDTDASLMSARRASLVDKCVEKTYRALLLYCPPPASRMGTEERWYLNPKGSITRDVFANGADYSLQRAADDTVQSGRLPTAWMDRRPATTAYRVLQYFPSSRVYYVEVQLRSGRRHQIRQHFAQMCHPLVGDGRYHDHAMLMGKELGLQRPALHAFRITFLPLHSCNSGKKSGNAEDFIDVVSGADGWEKTVVECSLPSDMRRALRLLQEREEVTSLGATPL